MRLFTKQVPREPLRIKVNYTNRGSVVLSNYSTFTVNIVDPFDVPIKSIDGDIDTYLDGIDGKDLLIPWSFLGVDTNTFTLPGDYKVQVVLKDAGVEDVTTAAIIEVHKRIA